MKQREAPARAIIGFAMLSVGASACHTTSVERYFPAGDRRVVDVLEAMQGDENYFVMDGGLGAGGFRRIVVYRKDVPGDEASLDELAWSGLHREPGRYEGGAFVMECHVPRRLGDEDVSAIRRFQQELHALLHERGACPEPAGTALVYVDGRQVSAIEE
ncbi:MAG: hypothetical protein R3F30_09930 [Planctomycetota bacterium]